MESWYVNDGPRVSFCTAILSPDSEDEIPGFTEDIFREKRKALRKSRREYFSKQQENQTSPYVSEGSEPEDELDPYRKCENSHDDASNDGDSSDTSTPPSDDGAPIEAASKTHGPSSKDQTSEAADGTGSGAVTPALEAKSRNAPFVFIGDLRNTQLAVHEPPSESPPSEFPPSSEPQPSEPQPSGPQLSEPRPNRVILPIRRRIRPGNSTLAATLASPKATQSMSDAISSSGGESEPQPVPVPADVAKAELNPYSGNTLFHETLLSNEFTSGESSSDVYESAPKRRSVLRPEDDS
ncbi:hypothetical protein F5X68DRAFT_229573 [Plectosphaerella plurivora]|uniref:Uncharacterized protein n=1 Tax=Plectosphaerella plurivora TaxID=936078 RepID=A0A9P8VHF6_9PEZI|nr:hypothetical protein F5X68DRAFT_229573 [Plectosphaerella plurivora]